MVRGDPILESGAHVLAGVEVEGGTGGQEVLELQGTTVAGGLEEAALLADPGGGPVQADRPQMGLEPLLERPGLGTTDLLGGWDHVTTHNGGD